MNKYRVLILAAASMLMFSFVRAGECGDGLPCGSIPWPQPNPPQLQSPTPMPTIGVTTIPPTQTPGGATATPSPAPTSNNFGLDIDGIGQQFATLRALAEATDPVIEVSGTPVSQDDQMTTLTDNSATFFGYVRAVNEIDLGGLTPIIGFVTLSFLTVLGTKAVTLIVPVVMALFGLIKKIISFVISFFP